MNTNLTNPDGSLLKERVNKPMFELIDPDFILGVACILTHGAYKYSPNSWQSVPKEEYHGALNRHINAYLRGESFDRSSQMFHLDHAACDLMFLRWFETQNKRKRNRINFTITNGLYIPQEAKK